MLTALLTQLDADVGVSGKQEVLGALQGCTQEPGGFGIPASGTALSTPPPGTVCPLPACPTSTGPLAPHKCPTGTLAHWLLGASRCHEPPSLHLFPPSPHPPVTPITSKPQWRFPAQCFHAIHGQSSRFIHLGLEGTFPTLMKRFQACIAPVPSLPKPSSGGDTLGGSHPCSLQLSLGITRILNTILQSKPSNPKPGGLTWPNKPGLQPRPLLPAPGVMGS